MNYRYPLFWPYMNGTIKKAVMKTLDTRWLGQGPQVDDFERLVEEYFKLEHRALAVNSGTAALEMAYEAVGIKEGDRVLVPVLTCSATTIPLLRRKANIIFVDVDEKTLCPNLNDVLRKLDDGIKAVVTVDLGGIKSGIKDLGVPVIEDAAQAFGFFDGDYVATSFQAIKFFTTGDGGMVFTKNMEQYRRLKKLRWFGIDRTKKRQSGWQAYRDREMTFDIEEAGYKWHMNDIAASMGIAAMSFYKRIIEHRRKVFFTYQTQLGKVRGLRVINAFHNLFWLMGIIVDNREDLAKKLAEHGVETNTVHLRNDIYQIFGGKRQDLPHMNAIEMKYLYLPINPKITVEDAYKISSIIKEGW